MSLRRKVRSALSRVSQALSASAAVDHPANGGITGDLEPPGDDIDPAEKPDSEG